MEVVGLRKREKNVFLALVVFSKNKKKTRSVYGLLRILPHLVMAYIMKGAGLVRLLDEWNTDSVLVPLLLTS